MITSSHKEVCGPRVKWCNIKQSSSGSLLTWTCNVPKDPPKFSQCKALNCQDEAKGQDSWSKLTNETILNHSTFHYYQQNEEESSEFDLAKSLCKLKYERNNFK